MSAPDRLRTLKGLAGYRCGHTGSCCRAGWPIPVEPEPLGILQQALRTGRIAPRQGAALVDGHILGCSTDRECVFHATGASGGGCRLEQVVGVSALAASCRQFPRILLRDARGWHQTLSAWCGTAAKLIVQDDHELRDFISFARIEEDPRVHVESLDARQEWPPLLRPGVLAGHEAYAAWEQLVLHRLAQVDAGMPASHVLHTVLTDTSALREWRPDEDDLLAQIQRLPLAGDVTSGRTVERTGQEPLKFLLYDLIDLIPRDWQPSDWPRGVVDAVTGGRVLTRLEAERALARYLATRLTGSWVAYQGQGLLSVLASLIGVHALVAAALSREPEGPITIGHLTNSLRAADWLVLHLLDRQDWAAWCARAEAAPDAYLRDLIHAAETALESCRWSASTGTSA